MEADNPFEARPKIDSFVLADWAEAINGKLYLAGGGFETIFLTNFPTLVHFALGAILHVPWNDTNRRLRVEAQVEDDAHEPLGWWNLQGEVEAGRPPGARGGHVAIVFAAPVVFQVAEPPDPIPYLFGVRLRFADDERRLPVQLAPPPSSPLGQVVQPPPSGDS